ncbi:cupin domain-containing protein [Singulisphaera rosea]
MPTNESRREFARQTIQSLTALALIDGLAARHLFGADVRPILDEWFKELETISRDVHDHKVKDVEFQKSLEDLYRRVELPALLKTLDFDRIAAGVKFPAVGARSLPVDFKNISGLSTKLVFGGQIFAMTKGRSVVPHGHDNMATGFLILNGTLRGRHYDRIEDHDDHYIVRPTLDRSFARGESSTISDHKDNVHWFMAESEHAFIFNIHVMETNPENPKKPGRVYVDPLGEKLAGGLYKAPKISYGRVNQLYG